MNKISVEQKIARSYLLGNLDDPGELRRIEEKLLLDEHYAEQLSIAEDELIEQYLDGELSAPESEMFRQFFLAPPERKLKLALIKNLRVFSAKTVVQPVILKPAEENNSIFDWFLTPVFLRFVVVILLVGGIGFIVWRTVIYESGLDKGLAQMRSAYQGTRPLESRSTVNFGYAPLTVTRGDSKVSPTDSKSLDRAELLLLDAAENPSDARAHHALGIFYLNEKEFDKAQAEFDTALKLSPDDTKLNSDLGALYLEKANQAAALEKESDILENLARSLESLNRALQIDENLPEALFNKALVVQKMRLPNQAREAWQKYLDKDSTSEWANEARKNLEDLQRQEIQPKDKSQILQDFLDAFRERDDKRAWQIAGQTKELITGVMIQQQLVNKFLEADQQSRKEEAEEILSAFLHLGKIEKQNTGDPFFTELSEYYSSANSVQKKTLLLAHEKLDSSYQLIRDNKFEKASETLKESRNLFVSAGNKWEIYPVDYQTAYCLTQLGDSAESNRLLFNSVNQLKTENYWLQALFYGWIGSNYSGQGDFSQAIFYDRKSLETARRISDTYNIQRSLNQLANEYRRIGNLPETLNYSFRGFITSELYYHPPRQQFRNLFFASQTLVEAGFYEAALAYAKENLNLAENILKSDWQSHSVRVQIGTIYGKIGDYERSFRELEGSLEIARRLPDEIKIKQLSARSYLSLADIQRVSGNCPAAQENYDRVLSIYQTIEFSVNIYEAEKGKLLCHFTNNDQAAVMEKMPVILNSFDKYRQKLKEDEKISFFNSEQKIYDSAIAYFYGELKNPVEAFNYSENSRSRSLLGLLHNESNFSRTLSHSEVREKMPAGVQMVYYTVLPDKLLIWYISKNKISTVEKFIRHEDLAKEIGAYRKNLTGKFDGSINNQLSKKLYELLISPISNDLERNSTICFVADKDLFQIPFTSLISPESGKYLIEDYAVMLAPSASVFIEESEIAAQKNRSGKETILSIGNPAFSRAQYPDLSDLPSADHESETVASGYFEKYIYKGKQAVKSRIITDFQKSEIIHYAGHYIPNLKSPSLSKFILASENAKNAETDLSVGEIIKEKLPRTKLIILSACETGVEKFYNGEGMIGAARAFLASDVPLVVASQWSVDSKATAELMVKFHNYRTRENLKTVEALRRAQIDMLRNGNPIFQNPFYWSGFLPIGGFADF